MNTKLSKTISLSLLLFVSTMIFLPSTASTADVMWEENFESGLDNWYLSGFNASFLPVAGNFSDTNGILRITGDDNHENFAEHPSTQATGTWSFDVDVTPTKRNHFYIAFFGEKMGNLSEVSFSEVIAYEYGILVVTAPLASWDSEFVFYKRIKGSSSVTSLGRYSPSQILGWHHFDITRNIDGEFNVFINGSLRGSFQDTTYTTAEVFRLSGGPGPGIDNIVV
ncbi:MAG: hypothetical protein ACFFD4_26100, partial [Candidatus Odinarchaeota archaeon]